MSESKQAHPFPWLGLGLMYVGGFISGIYSNPNLPAEKRIIMATAITFGAIALLVLIKIGLTVILSDKGEQS